MNLQNKTPIWQSANDALRLDVSVTAAFELELEDLFEEDRFDAKQEPRHLTFDYGVNDLLDLYYY